MKRRWKAGHGLEGVLLTFRMIWAKVNLFETAIIKQTLRVSAVEELVKYLKKRFLFI